MNNGHRVSYYTKIRNGYYSKLNNVQVVNVSRQIQNVLQSNLYCCDINDIIKFVENNVSIKSDFNHSD